MQRKLKDLILEQIQAAYRISGNKPQSFNTEINTERVSAQRKGQHVPRRKEIFWLRIGNMNGSNSYSVSYNPREFGFCSIETLEMEIVNYLKSELGFSIDPRIGTLREEYLLGAQEIPRER